MLNHKLPEYTPLVDNKVRLVTEGLRKNDTFRAEVMDQVRDALYDYGDLKKLALDIGRSERCLYQLRGGYTLWPRWETLFALLPPLGLELRIVKIGHRYH